MDTPHNTSMTESVHRMGLAEKYAGQKLERISFDDIVPGLDADISKRPVLLYNVSHVQRSPVARDPEKPAIRLLGVFQDGADAIAQAELMSRKVDPVDYWVTPLGEWMMLHADRAESAETVSTRIAERLARTEVKRQRDFEQLRAARDKKIQSHTSYHKTERTKRHEDKTPVRLNTDPGTNAKELSQRFMRNNQRYAVVSVVPDTGRAVRLRKKVPEPLFRVYGVFAGKKAAKEYVKTELSAHVGDYDLDVVDMYEWLHPQNLNPEDIVEEFRDPEINNIMQHAKDEQRTAKDFRKRCAAMGKEADMEYIAGAAGKDSVTLIGDFPELGAGRVAPDAGSTLQLVEVDPDEVEADHVMASEQESEAVLRGLVGDEAFETVKRDALAYYSQATCGAASLPETPPS